MKENKKNLLDMILIIQISMVIFTVIIFYIHLSEYFGKIKIGINGRFNLFTIVFLLMISVIIYSSHKIIILKEDQYKIKSELKWLVENIIFIILISLLDHIFSGYDNEYKYVFLLLILSSTIQYGSRYGILTSLISSITILAGDLIRGNVDSGINMIFQKDIIMTGIFIVIGWVLGYYVDLVASENEEKENKLNMLNSKLEEKKKQREEMKLMIINNEACYDTLFENSINAVFVHKDGMILYANKSAVSLLGYDNIDNFDKKNIYEFYNENEVKFIKNKYRQIEKEKMSKIIEEEKIINIFGEIIPVSNVSSFFLYKEESAVLSVLTDIRNEKKIEKLKSDMEKNIKILNDTKEFNVLIRNFFINMSHELKTPVNVMYSAIQALNVDFEEYDEVNKSRDRAYIKSMKQNCLRMIRLINNFVDATRLEAGELKINKENADIVNIVEGIVEKTVQYLKDKDIQIIFDTNVEEKIMAFDKEVLKRVILNIISNSIKFGFEKRVILINLIAEEEAVSIKIKDNGKGIEKNKMNLIFERFAKGDSSLARECEGSGMGLYFAKSFIELHHGEIKVMSNIGVGTEVTIKLPSQIIDNNSYSNRIILETDEEKIEREFSDIYTI
ncbi:PAS domain-containing sensor histidine kinase [uncultured Clostridium sp.]|uniref:sensor histidine kinase n=1 Tax=uncultured Clostridium sp. TaxID=59620 RepID=UPI0025DFC422|nr:PAS domain-containing sensor histidine kinase [uncultured Clostridium sp.]